MINYIIRRVLYAIIILIMVSVVAFIIIQLPPGDYLNTVIMRLQAAGHSVSQAEIEALRRQYGLDRSIFYQYAKWTTDMLRGNFGRSFQYNEPVARLLANRLPLTIALSVSTLLFTYIVSIPIGIYSAVRQYSVVDYTFTVIGFIGLAVPNFLLALILMFFMHLMGMSVGGLFSPQFATQSWSFAKFVDLLKHMPVPIIVIGTAGTAGIIRVLRACLLDELKKQYVVTALAKGLHSTKLLFKYPVRIALNPIISTIGWLLPAIFSGETITAIVLSLPTIGPLLYESLMNQDMYIAGSIVVILSFLTIVGTFMSDILLVLFDPRIRFEKKAGS